VTTPSAACERVNVCDQYSPYLLTLCLHALLEIQDFYFQKKMHLERTAFAAAKTTPATRPTAAPRRPSGPRQGVMAELRRIDPSGQRQVSRATEARCTALGWILEHLGVTIGTVIHGPDLSEAQSEEMIGAINDVLLERKVVVFQGQSLSEEGQIAFGKNWGALEVFPFAVADGNLGVDPQIHRFHVGTPGAGAAPPSQSAYASRHLTDSDADEEADHAATLEQMSAKHTSSGWHSDVTWRKTPSLGSMLYCDIAPPFGGATSFSDCYAAWQGLTDEEQAALRGRYCMHDFDHFRQGQVNSGVSEETAEELRRSYPQVGGAKRFQFNVNVLIVLN
jgi:alpha-ketoglutarate-dependent taurine dioxygenase